LHIIAYFGTHSVLSKIAPAATEVDSKDSKNRTPLWWASSNGYKDVVWWLLENGAQPNSKDEDGRTPLSQAIEIGNEAVVEQLLIKGAKVDYFYKTVSESNQS
jgi:ankyrin repeat protein